MNFQSEMLGGRPPLARVVGSVQFFALSFGCIVGSGWVVVLGEWLAAAGPGGAIVGFAIGASVMLAVAACYAELTSRMPSAGGEVVYAYEAFGPPVAFFIGWFLTLSMIAIAAFEGTALGWVIGVLWPKTQGRVLYELFGEPVRAGSLILGCAGVLIFAGLNYVGVKSSARFQTAVTLTFLLISMLIVALGLSYGKLARIPPLFQLHGSQSWWAGILWIIGIAPFFLNGFQAAAQAVEERSDGTSFVKIARAMYAAVVFAGVFYCAIVLACSMAVPWQSLIEAPLATAAAMNEVLPGGRLSQVVLIAAAISIIKTWNGVILWASRLILAQARARFIPYALGSIHPRLGSPYRAVLLVAVANLAGVALGRGALLPIVNMGAICLSFSLVLTCLAVLILRDRGPRATYEVPGGRITIVYAIGGSGVMATFALVSPWFQPRHHFPLEWALLIVWAGIGAVFWFTTRGGRAALGPAGCRCALLGDFSVSERARIQTPLVLDTLC